MTRSTCITCRFWRNEHHPGAMGDCRRYAPRAATAPVGERGPQYAQWPRTNEDDWCGEHKPVLRSECVHPPNRVFPANEGGTQCAVCGKLNPTMAVHLELTREGS